MERDRRHARIIPRWFLALAFLILLGPTLQAVLNLAPVRSMIAQYLMSETGLGAGDLHIRVLPRPRVQLFDVVMREGARSEPAFRADRVEVAIRLWPLLRGRIALAKLIVVAPQVTISRDREGQWHLPFREAREMPPGETDEDRVFISGLPPDLELTGGEIRLLDERTVAPLGSFSLTDIHFVSVTHSLERRADLRLTGQAQAKGQLAPFALIGSLAGPDSPSGLPQAIADHPPLWQFSGQVEIHGLDTQPWNEWLESGAARQDLGGRLDVTAQVTVAPRVVGYNVSLFHLDARLDWLAVQGKGEVQGLGAESLTYRVALSSSPFSLEAFARMSRSCWSIRTFGRCWLGEREAGCSR
jgi:uncharacterized protein involved in outer membrane biogenesis